MDRADYTTEDGKTCLSDQEHSLRASSSSSVRTSQRDYSTPRLPPQTTPLSLALCLSPPSPSSPIVSKYLSLKSLVSRERHARSSRFASQVLRVSFYFIFCLININYSFTLYYYIYRFTLTVNPLSYLNGGELSHCRITEAISFSFSGKLHLINWAYLGLLST